MRWTGPFALVVVVATAALVAGCGDDEANGEQGASQSGAAMKDDGRSAMEEVGAMEEEAMKSDASASAARGKLIKVVGSEYGRVIADGRGEAFYLFDKESTKKSKCYGECARAWPPVLTKGRPRAGKGAKAKLLGTTKRTNGKLQATYAGQPLYYYVDDSPGTILCQDVSEFGGLWLVVKPSGAPVT
jgi:predicted lipoprotein with Yx(FWY)xxD motif